MPALQDLATNSSGDRMILAWFAALIVISSFGVLYCDAQINDPSKPPYIGSRLKVTTDDLALASQCVRDTFASRNVVTASRHEFVMSDWACRLSESKRVAPSTAKEV